MNPKQNIDQKNKSRKRKLENSSTMKQTNKEMNLISESVEQFSEVCLHDHDYSIISKSNESEMNETSTEPIANSSQSMLHDHDYCNESEINETCEPIANSSQSMLHDHDYSNKEPNDDCVNIPTSSTSNVSNFRIIHDVVLENQTYRVHNISNQNPNNDDNLNEVVEHYLGPMNVLCIHCNAKHFRAEKVSNRGNSFNDCCSHGKVMLDPLPQPPEILRELFDGTHDFLGHFFYHIRSINSSFSLASFNANLVKFNNRRPGPFCFKIQGQVYYQVNTSLYPAENDLPSFGQLFIIDSNEATSVRLKMNSTLNSEVLTAIDNVMRQCNVFVQSYQMMKEELDSMTNENDGVEPELQLLFTLKKGHDKRRYNFQRVNEVAAIFSTTADGEIPESYVTIRNRNTKELQYVSSMDPNVEPWTYPLFYPYGTRGWYDGLRMVDSDRRVTRNAYIKHRIAIRDDESNYILKGRRLFQQWTVDQCVKVEKDKMNFLRKNQKQLRADTYDSLLAHLEKNAENTNNRVGNVIILPSTYQGSPRNMQQNYQDAMTIVRKFGKPDLFITMTCNPKWKEITENLLDGQTASDRPDLVARVFDLKKEELIKIIVKENLFGKVQAYVYVVEYQKRGLPHVHMLLTLKQNCKIRTPDIVDKFISAEIPHPNENLQLHEIVKSNMVHGPCGDWCLDKNGKCSKNYPRQFNDQTNMDEDGYPQYRRRSTETYHRRDGFEFDNQRIVPHNKKLLLLLNCHINVEIVASIKAVKYLYKYIYKGHDSAAVVLQEVQNNENQETGVLDHDEIKNYIESRYISPPEACGRILSNKLHDKSHSICRLPIHLPNQQTVIVENVDNPEAIRSALNGATELDEYFALNKRDPEAHNYTYSEIPEHYVFQKNRNSEFAFTWQKRKTHFNILGRMYSVSPSQTELFHLRLLLISVKGATSYEDLRTVEGVVNESFVSTCLALGLIEDDNEWKNAMHEAEVWMMPRQLRQLFIRILIHCQPVHPEELWEEFKDALSQDYLRTMPVNLAHKKAYIQINTLLTAENSSLAAFPSMAQITETDEDIENEILFEQHQVIGTEQYQKLNEKQKQIVDIVLETINDERGNENLCRCFFIDGPGGSGKTFVYTTLYHLLRSKQKQVCTMAFTGIAATLLPHGKTVHKTFKLPIAIYNDSSLTIKAQSKEAKYLKSIDVFFWDEAPMAPRHVLQLVDRNLRDVMNNDEPFGGKIMILGGDFRQLLPVKQNAIRSELVNLCIKFSSVWPASFQFSLTENMRALPHEKEFSKFLLQVGNVTANHDENDLALPEDCIATFGTDIAEDIYGEVIRKKQFEKLTKMAILSARNVDVDDINKSVVELLDVSTEKIYTSINTVKNCDNNELGEALLPEYLETLNPPNLPPHELRLRVNTVVMLIRNLSINEGLCNGTRLQILELKNHLLKCKILTGDRFGQIVFINRITLYSDDRYPFQFGRRQFPIKIAFAMTINKSQGQTFDKIGIDLKRDVFNHGQLYVALSRVRSWSSLRIYLNDQRESNVVKNFVFREIYD